LQDITGKFASFSHFETELSTEMKYETANLEIHMVALEAAKTVEKRN